jgi:phosphatidylglycerol:prolipoprotein diacylglycerol transferase
MGQHDSARPSRNFVMWATAALVCLPLGVWLARREGFPWRRSLIALALLSGVILGGAKLLYLLEVQLCPDDDYVPAVYRGVAHGFRIPGGILLLATLGPFVIGRLGLPWRRFGDGTIFIVPVMLVLVRLGCLLNGCCFGRLSQRILALRFPGDSWAHWFHASSGWIARDAPASLPVHPLQLYFIGASLVTLALLVALDRLGSPDGVLQLVFYAVFFATTALLEPLRANFLTLNNLLAPAAAVFFLTRLLVLGLRRTTAHLHTVSRE